MREAGLRKSDGRVRPAACDIQSFETGGLPSRPDVKTDVAYRYLRVSNGKTVEDATETLSPNTADTLRSLK
jgi:hypothetical protein